MTSSASKLTVIKRYPVAKGEYDRNIKDVCLQMIAVLTGARERLIDFAFTFLNDCVFVAPEAMWTKWNILNNYMIANHPDSQQLVDIFNNTTLSQQPEEAQIQNIETLDGGPNSVPRNFLSLLLNDSGDILTLDDLSYTLHSAYYHNRNRMCIQGLAMWLQCAVWVEVHEFIPLLDIFDYLHTLEYEVQEVYEIFCALLQDCAGTTDVPSNSEFLSLVYQLEKYSVDIEPFNTLPLAVLQDLLLKSQELICAGGDPDLESILKWLRPILGEFLVLPADDFVLALLEIYLVYFSVKEVAKVLGILCETDNPHVAVQHAAILYCAANYEDPFYCSDDDMSYLRERVASAPFDYFLDWIDPLLMNPLELCMFLEHFSCENYHDSDYSGDSDEEEFVCIPDSIATTEAFADVSATFPATFPL